MWFSEPGEFRVISMRRILLEDPVCSVVRHASELSGSSPTSGGAPPIGSSKRYELLRRPGAVFCGNGAFVPMDDRAADREAEAKSASTVRSFL